MLEESTREKRISNCQYDMSGKRIKPDYIKRYRIRENTNLSKNINDDCNGEISSDTGLTHGEIPDVAHVTGETGSQKDTSDVYGTATHQMNPNMIKPNHGKQIDVRSMVQNYETMQKTINT